MDAAGTAKEWKTISGTADQITVTPSVGGVTFSTPQSIATTSNVTFGTVTAASTITGQALTAAVLSAELITEAVDRDFSAANNWTGTGWSVGSGVFTHVAGANNASLANVNLSEAPIAGEYYQVIITLTTSITGTVSINIGGTASSNIGVNTLTQTAYTVVLLATNTNPLTITPNGSWVGTLDDVSVKKVSKNTAALILKDSTSAIVIEERPINSTTIGIGLNSLVANVSGTGNTAVGSNTLSNMVSGLNNTAMGNSALSRNTIGSDNTAFGANALALNTVSTGNTAIGKDTLANTLFTTMNTAVGNGALKTCTTGSNNTAVGSGAMTSSTSGATSTAIGTSALTSLTSGTANTAIGQNSLPAITTVSNNTALGKDAGFNSGTSLSLVSGCTFIGQGANASTNSLSNSIALGKGAQVTASNQIVIGDANVTSLTTAAAINTALNYKVATVQVVGAQVAAIGLDAQTDAQKITAIISALRAHGLLGPNA